MYARIFRRTALLTSLLVAVVLTNARCGEYLLLDFLLKPRCNTENASTSQPDATAVGSTDNPNASDTPTPPPPDPEPKPEPKPGLQPVTVQPLPADAVTIDLPRPTGGSGQTVPTCLTGDLNKDGAVDGLDIQILVDCMLSQ
ncbi:MAG: hypothetical protein ACE5E1_00825 [Phycisphaerae bacterium]